MVPRPEDADLFARDFDLVKGEQRLDAGGRAGHGALHAEGETAHIHGVQAINVLIGVDLQQSRLEVDLGRCRVLDQDGVDALVVVEGAHGVHHLLLRGVVAEVDVRAGEADLFAFSIFMRM